MTKVVKFGGSSLADAEQFKKVRAILESDPTRRIVVVSAPGKRFADDVKITDMLLLCQSVQEQGLDLGQMFQKIRTRYKEIVQNLNVDIDIDALLDETEAQMKKNGTKELFDKSKLLSGLMKACEKRPVSFESIDNLVNEIEKTVYNLGSNEVSSDRIGDEVMKGLKELDQVAYVRFASVYKEFKDIDTFLAEIERILGKK